MDARLKKLHFRSWHRGTREVDLLLGTFADRHLASLSPGDLDTYEALLEVQDPVLYEWLVGRAEPPPAFDTQVLRRIRAVSGPVCPA